MNILYLAHRIPYPPNKGDKIRSFHEIKFLCKGNDLHLAFLVDDPQDLQHVDALKGLAKTVEYAVIDPRWQKFASIPYLVTGKPLSIPYFYSSSLQQAVDRTLDENEIEAVICFSSPMAEYIFKSRHYRNGKLKKAQLLMDFVDVDSDKWRLYAASATFPFSVIYRREWRRLEEYDAKVGSIFDWSVFVSDKEVELFTRFAPRARAVAIRNGVDLDYFSEVSVLRGKRRNERPTAIFIGAMDYHPNEDAVVHFAEEILPLVKRTVPDIRFCIVGGKPSRRVQQLARIDGVVVTGFVPDVRPWLAEADLFVAPFRIARGVQNKVLEAMAAGLPVVARPDVVQGFPQLGEVMRVADSAEGFAAAVAGCLSEATAAANLASNAKRVVESRCRWDENMAGFSKLLATDRWPT